ncbi:capsular polysaccharide biosynthesis protein [Streptohalobacillus salinus]|uniref:Capsular polysaccharide biosynthesis protein n=1 Tax=Streptohalobacillus salinus TaxID=621096 RepID=A0A2V3WEI7_9BACI|nr:Wzz/FepE/Etk N-terminal domain-containing protein [Streptohalobacillus salinus]PXW92018.1 capsular polysaccharide biosynthesis protein [Streptohalobacillus salinus]
MEETISLKELATVIKKRLGMIITVSLFAAAISGIVTVFLITKEYQVSTQFLVNQNNTEQTNTIQSSDIRTNIDLINTYNVIITSNRILDEVIDELELDLSATALSNKITVQNENNSQVVTVSVRDTDPIQAERIANTTVAVFQEEVFELMNVDNVNVLNRAEVGSNPAPVSPNLMLNIAIALVLGGMVSVGVTFLLEYLDNSVKTEDDVENILGMPVLGVISHISDRDMHAHHAVPKQHVQPVARTKRERRA